VKIKPIICEFFEKYLEFLNNKITLFCTKNRKKNSSAKIVKNIIFTSHKKVISKFGNLRSKTKKLPKVPRARSIINKGAKSFIVWIKIFF